MAYCVNCGNEILDQNSKFCASCGYKISNETSQQDLINIGEGEDNGDEILLNNFISEVSSKLTDRAMDNLLKPVEFTSNRIYIHPNIPGKKIYNFLKKFVLHDEFIVKLYLDCTIFGKGDYGLCVVEINGEDFIFISQKNYVKSFKMVNDGNYDVQLYFIRYEKTNIFFYYEQKGQDRAIETQFETGNDKVAKDICTYIRQEIVLNNDLFTKHSKNSTNG